MTAPVSTGELIALLQSKAWIEDDAAEQIIAALQRLEPAERDAGRYRWLREQHHERNTMCVVVRPRDNVRLGSLCPSADILDFDIDAAIAAARVQP